MLKNYLVFRHEKSFSAYIMLAYSYQLNSILGAQKNRFNKPITCLKRLP